MEKLELEVDLSDLYAKTFFTHMFPSVKGHNKNNRQLFK